MAIINLENFKKNWYLILIAFTTVILGIVAVVTAIRLYQLSREPVAPTAPKPAPAVAPQCILTFNIATPTSTPTPTPTGAPFACLDLTKDIDLPEVGEIVTFTCEGDPGSQVIDHFNFRYQIDGGEYTYINDVEPLVQPMPETTVRGEIELEITAGEWHVQCQACVIDNNGNPDCTQWGEAH